MKKLIQIRPNIMQGKMVFIAYIVKPKLFSSGYKIVDGVEWELYDKKIILVRQWSCTKSFKHVENISEFTHILKELYGQNYTLVNWKG